MNVIKFLLKITLLTMALLSMSSISHAHSYSSQVKVKYPSRIQVIPIPRAQNKLLPKALYVRTIGHTFKRRFTFQNKVIKQVYYDPSQPVHKLYAVLSPKSFSSKPTTSYWP